MRIGMENKDRSRRADEPVEVARRELKAARKEANRLAHERPLTALATAAGVGFLAGRRPLLLTIGALAAGVALGTRLSRA